MKAVLYLWDTEVNDEVCRMISRRFLPLAALGVGQVIWVWDRIMDAVSEIATTNAGIKPAPACHSSIRKVCHCWHRKSGEDPVQNAFVHP